ncbi:YiiD C-terminal domain-containing protein [Bacteriovoracaceae bacterium]|nr:YiiD C-terminal domain-containing protein [Bacteriovoracaceae bacterium]
MLKKLSFKNLIRVMNIYPPYIGAGVKIKIVDEKKYELQVEMPLTKLNRNYMGTHFGGSLYSMIDPFYCLILIRKLGREYLVWDKSAQIDFKSPGKGRVKAHFCISDEQVKDIVDKVEEHGKFEPEFEVSILDENDKVVACAQKKLWVKKKS